MAILKFASLVVAFVAVMVTCEPSNFRNASAAARSTREAIAAEGSKRYLVFPQGSNVQLIYCMTIGTYAKPSGFFTVGVTAGLAWELPHRNTVPRRKPAEVYHRRSRRELYRKLELMLSTWGFTIGGALGQSWALCFEYWSNALSQSRPVALPALARNLGTELDADAVPLLDQDRQPVLRFLQTSTGPRLSPTLNQYWPATHVNSGAVLASVSQQPWSNTRTQPKQQQK